MVHGLRCPLISSVEQYVLILVYIETCIRQTIAYLEKTKMGLLQNRPKKKRQAGQPEKGCLACLFALGLVCEHKTKARPV